MKDEMLAQIAPLSLVPFATGTGFLILGSRGENTCPGHPQLPIFLLLAGTMTIGLGIMNNVSKFVISYGLSDQREVLTREELVGLAIHAFS